MEKICELCEKSRAIVKCKGDAAFLCLVCDTCVHSANAVSSRHSRSLLCECCGENCVSVRCFEHGLLCMCHKCDERMHGEGNAEHHKKGVEGGYTGCPSANDLAIFWGYDLNAYSQIPSSNNPQTKSRQQQDTSFVLQQILDLERLQLTQGKDTTSVVGCPLQADVCSSKENTSGLSIEDLEQNCHCQHQQVVSTNELQVQDLEVDIELVGTPDLVQLLDLDADIEQVVSTPNELQVEDLEEADIEQVVSTPNELQVEDLEVDIEQVVRSPNELQVQDIPFHFPQSDNTNSSLSGETNLDMDPMWQCEHPAQKSQAWTGIMQDLGISEVDNCNDGPIVLHLDSTVENYEELLGDNQILENDLSIGPPCSFLENDFGCISAIKDIAVAPTSYITPSHYRGGSIGMPDQTNDILRSMNFTYQVQPTLSASLSRFSAETSTIDYINSPSTNFMKPAPSFPRLRAETSTIDCIDSSLSINLAKEGKNENAPDLESKNWLARGHAMRRYQEKKKVRTYGKIRYACRRAGAAVRKRVKGRFVKAEGGIVKRSDNREIGCHEAIDDKH